MDKAAERLVYEFIRARRAEYHINFTDSNGNVFKVHVEQVGAIRKDMSEGIEKLGGRISAGPSGMPCGRCGGSGYV
jgi:hypothetical protein